MVIAPTPDNEIQRLEKLINCNILDTETESDFDEVVALASKICGVPTSLISLLDTERQWFKARIGLDFKQTDRDVSFCGHAIMNDDIFEIADASKDYRFFDNPLVKGNPNICFYAGMPLVTDDGFKLGVLCVMDKKPNHLNDDQKEALRVLAKQTISNIELRAATKKLEQALEANRRLIAVLSHDIRTPIATLQSMVPLIKKELLSVEDTTVMLDAWEKQALETQMLLDNILQWSADTVENKPFFKQTVVLTDLINEQFAVLSAKSKMKGNEMFNTVDEHLQVKADPHMLAFIVRNLLDNANKFTNNGTIIVTTEVLSSCTRINVGDTGTGIKEEDRLRLLNDDARFFKKGTGGEKGFGLGILLSKQFIEKHNGTLRIEHNSPCGTIFQVELP